MTLDSIEPSFFNSLNTFTLCFFVVVVVVLFKKGTFSRCLSSVSS